MRITFFIPFLLCLSLLFFPVELWAATSSTGKQKVTKTQQKSTVKKQTPLQRLQNDLLQLKADDKRASLRHNWLQLESRIEAYLKKKSKEADALLLAAQCREGLAQRSQAITDYRLAAEKYERFAKRLPKHAQTPAMLYKQAELLADKGRDPQSALKAVNSLVNTYPKTQAGAKGERLRQKLTASKPAVSSPKTPQKGTATQQKAVPPRQPSGKGSTVAQQLGLGIKTVMIDAGHGGKDPGTMANGIEEKAFTLKMSKRIGQQLQQRGLTVIYTRSSDTFISLQERPVIANNKKADLFISIHVNANNNHAIRGLETYYLDAAQTEGAVSVAARENGVSVKEISNLQIILADLMLGSKLNESKQLAKAVQKAMLSTIAAAKYSMPDNGVRSAPFHVLIGAKMPAILVEFGYVTNVADAKLLQSEKFLDKQVEGLVGGILAYKQKIEKFGSR